MTPSPLAKKHLGAPEHHGAVSSTPLLVYMLIAVSQLVELCSRLDHLSLMAVMGSAGPRSIFL
jgi:hypothetical protein